ncbi:MAG: nuclear transport factor 2 family protein [Actinomycetota bacterium]|nr:nuclear transport factor 2 family protein [Actinomycetota bacterium]
MRGFQAFAEGDMEAMKGLFAEDATWHRTGRNKWSGDYTGPDAIREMLSGLAFDATIENTPHAVLADDDHVVALINTSQTRRGRSFNGEATIVFHVGDGKITEAWTILTDTYGFDEFWTD